MIESVNDWTLFVAKEIYSAFDKKYRSQRELLLAGTDITPEGGSEGRIRITFQRTTFGRESCQELKDRMDAIRHDIARNDKPTVPPEKYEPVWFNCGLVLRPTQPKIHWGIGTG